MLAIADSGLSEEELVEVAQATGFKRTDELVALLREVESLPDRAIDQRLERFIEQQ